MDREKMSLYKITLNASDNGLPRLFSLTTLTINVTDVNDNAPNIIGPSSGNVFENQENGTSVLHVKANDKDIGANGEFMFRLMNYLDLFSLNPSSGELKTKKPLDREEQDTYVTTINVQDKGEPALSSSKNITIKVSDIDDNCPVFQSPEYHATIQEGSLYGTYVTTVKATDIDIGNNAKLDYGVMTGNDKGIFKVNDENGEVTVIGEVDREIEGGTYWIKVRAGSTDCGVKRTGNIGEGSINNQNNYTFTTVYITVIDINDNPPKFVNGKEKINFSDIKTTEIIMLNATDVDDGPGGEVSKLNTRVLLSVTVYLRSQYSEFNEKN